MKKTAIVDYVGIKAGMHYYSLALLNALSKYDHQTHYLSNVNTEQVNSADCKIYNCFPVKVKKGGRGLFLMLSGLIRSVLYLKQNKVKNVIFHVFEASLLSLTQIFTYRLFGFRIIGIIHDVKPFKGKNSNWIEFLINNHLLHHIVVHNTYTKDEIEKSKAYRNTVPIHIIPHGNYSEQINPSITKASARQELNLDSNQAVFLFFGQIKGAKGLDILLKAFPRESKAHLIIAGKVWKEDYTLYQRIIEERKLDDSVSQYIRHIEDHERELFFKSADVIILPYKKIYQSGVLLMAMSYGLPAIVSNLEAFSELDDDTVLKFEKENCNDLKSKILFALNNPNEMKKRGKSSESIAYSKHSWAEIAKLYDLITK